MELKDLVISGHKENKHRQFYMTFLVKEDDISLEQREAIREACCVGTPVDLTINFSATNSTPPEANALESNISS